MWVADRRYCRTPSGEIVPDTHPEARTVIIGQGGEMPEHEARKLGLLKDSESKAILEPPENKARTLPEHKAITTEGFGAQAKRK